MKRELVFLTALLAWVSAAPVAQAVDLVRDGEAKCVIVISDKAKPIVTMPAEDLAHHLKLISGADVPVVTEKDMPAGVYPIYVGECAATRKMGIVAAKLPREGYRILIGDNAMAIVGNDVRDNPLHGYAQPATWFGVAHWLATQLNVRWLWPGDEGICFEPQTSIAVAPGDFTGGPTMPLRQVRSYYTTYRKLFLDDNMRGRIWPDVHYDFERHCDEYRVWERRVGLGRAGHIQAGHNMHWFYEQYKDSHPEYFAMQLNGSREPPSNPANVKLCISNPDVAKILIERGREELRRPDAITYNVGFTDSDGWCFCDNCKALDPPITPGMPLKTYPTFLPQGAQTIEYPFLTDRYLWLWNQVAEGLHEEYPDRYIGVLLYGACKAPPQFRKFHPNIIIAAARINDLRGPVDVDATVDDFNQWFDAGLRSFYWRPNLFWADHFGMPYPMAKPLGEVVKRLIDMGMKGFDQDAWNGHFGSDGVNLYVLTRLTDNPDQDVDALIDDYCQRGFGQAASLVREYYAVTDGVRQRTIGKLAHDELFNHGQEYFTAAVLDQLDALAKRIEETSQGDAPQFTQRVRTFLTAHRYTVLTGRSIIALNDPKVDPEKYYRDLYQAVEARESFVETQCDGWAINAAYVRYANISRKINNSGYTLYAKARMAQSSGAVEPWRVALGAGRLTVIPTRATIVVDGDLNDWPQGVQRYTLRENFSNQTTAAETSVSIACDDKSIYIAYRCEEPDEPYAAPREHDDGLIANNDCIEMIFAPVDFNQRYFHFISDILGDRYESQSTPDGRDVAWNGEWKAVVVRDGKVWSTEVEIPFQTLGFAAPPADATWIFNLYRTRRGPRVDEYQALSPTMSGYHDPQYFAGLHFQK